MIFFLLSLVGGNFSAFSFRDTLFHRLRQQSALQLSANGKIQENLNVKSSRVNRHRTHMATIVKSWWKSNEWNFYFSSDPTNIIWRDVVTSLHSTYTPNLIPQAHPPWQHNLSIIWIASCICWVSNDSITASSPAFRCRHSTFSPEIEPSRCQKF